jgi:hypothetical protein
MISTKQALLAALGAIALGAATASAGQYPGRGDTGWVVAGKRECCNEAIAQAQNDSAATCQMVGGTPNPMRGGVQRRGFCQWESAVDDDGVTHFRCYAEATVPCR